MSTVIAIRPTCEATIGKAAGTYGFAPVLCRQQVALTTLYGHSGDEHRACQRPGHVASVLRQYGTPEPADGRCELRDGRCLTHDAPDDMAHHFERSENQGHSAFGIARND